MKTCHSSHERRRGVALVIVLGTVALLTIAAAALQQTARSDYRASFNHLHHTQALYQAEAGVRQVMSVFSAAIRAGTNPQAQQFTLTTNYLASGFTYDLSPYIVRSGTDYAFSVTGRSHTARAILQVRMRRAPAMGGAGIFGRNEVYLAPNLNVYGYDSSIITNPIPSTTTGDARIGTASNGVFTVRPGVDVDGFFLIPPGVSAPNTNLYDVVYLENYPDPDPLGGSTSDGMLWKAFEYRKTHNDNSRCSQISGTQLNVPKKGATDIVLSSGMYYLTSLDIPANSVGLTINSTVENPVVIFMDGPMDFSPRNFINRSNRPGGLILFYRPTSGSSNPIKIMPNSGISMMLYAPRAEAIIQPGGDALGMFWGRQIQMKPGGNFFVDVSLTSSLVHYHMILSDWRIVYE